MGKGNKMGVVNCCGQEWGGVGVWLQPHPQQSRRGAEAYRMGNLTLAFSDSQGRVEHQGLKDHRADTRVRWAGTAPAGKVTSMAVG